ncbi:MAG: transposase [Microcoleaceae cyanobacterium MO_207.B10]|nr:transposase [Microcoleaceae cyanobacterium MO_207.B10]
MRFIRDLNPESRKLLERMSHHSNCSQVRDRAKCIILSGQGFSIHTSDHILNKLEEWKSKKLEIFWLPTYSPKQNIIEIFGKFIKSEWIEVGA